MKSTNIVRVLMEKNGMGLTSMAEAIGKTTQTVYERLTQENISVKKLNEMLGLLGYKLVAVPADEETRDGWFDAE